MDLVPKPGDEPVVVCSVTIAAHLLQWPEDAVRKHIHNGTIVARRDHRTGRWNARVPLSWVQPDRLAQYRPLSPDAERMAALAAQYRQDLLEILRKVEPQEAVRLAAHDAPAAEIRECLMAALDRRGTNKARRALKPKRYGTRFRSR